eukprot:1160947-Pelagomonas_calceolata.AAC.10
MDALNVQMDEVDRGLRHACIKHGGGVLRSSIMEERANGRVGKVGQKACSMHASHAGQEC